MKMPYLHLINHMFKDEHLTHVFSNHPYTNLSSHFTLPNDKLFHSNNEAMKRRWQPPLSKKRKFRNAHPNHCFKFLKMPTLHSIIKLDRILVRTVLKQLLKLLSSQRKITPPPDL